MENRTIYEDIAQRTDGDIYIGVVGPCAPEIDVYQAIYGDDGNSAY